MKAVLHFDGGARPRNPGYSACAYVLMPDGGEPVEFSRYLGIGTNNAAEYTGLIVGLKLANLLDVTSLDIFTDSQLIVGHINKGWTGGLALLDKPTQARELLDTLPDWRIFWIQRSGNALADQLCTAAINWGRNRNPWTRKL